MPPGLKKQFMRSAIVFSSAFVIFFVAVFLLKEDISKRATEAAQARLATKQNIELQNALANLKESMPKIEEYQSKLDALLPKRDQLIDVPRYIDSQARANQVDAKFSFGEEKAPGSGPVPGLGMMGYSMSVNGTYDNVIKFFKVVEENSPKYWMSIDSVRANKTAAGFSVQAGGNIYFQ